MYIGNIVYIFDAIDWPTVRSGRQAWNFCATDESRHVLYGFAGIERMEYSWWKFSNQFWKDALVRTLCTAGKLLTLQSVTQFDSIFCCQHEQDDLPRKADTRIVRFAYAQQFIPRSVAVASCMFMFSWHLLMTNAWFIVWLLLGIDFNCGLCVCFLTACRI